MKKTILMSALAFAASQHAYALPESQCDDYKDAWDACTASVADYVHGAAKLFLQNVCMANFGYTADVERVFCQLKNDLGIDYSAIVLGETVTASWDDVPVSVLFEEPTETFAVDAGYTVKVTVTYDDATTPFFVAYVAGDSEDATKGFAILGDNPLQSAGVEGALPEPEEDAELVEATQLRYVRWDKTDSAAESLDALAGNWVVGEGFLDYGDTEASVMMTGGQYIRMRYNADETKVTEMQFIKMNNKLGSETLVPACYQQVMWGKLGDLYVALNVGGDNPMEVDDESTEPFASLDDNDILEDEPTYPNGTNEGQIDALDGVLTLTDATTMTGPGALNRTCAWVNTGGASTTYADGVMGEFTADADPTVLFDAALE